MIRNSAFQTIISPRTHIFAFITSHPGKVAPVTSGELIAETIINILSERGEILN